MTRYTVSPPMLIEKSAMLEPDYDYWRDKGIANYASKAEALYGLHIASLQQIRMSEELVKWCEENKKVEIDEGEFEVRDVLDIVGRNGEKRIVDTVQQAFPLFAPVEVVNEWDKAYNDFKETTEYNYCLSLNLYPTYLNYLKSKYKLTRI